MNKLIYFFLLGVFVLSACSKDDEPDPPPAFIDELVGSYTGNYRELDCALSQTAYLEAANSSAVITKISDTEVDVTLRNSALGDFFNFSGTVDSDSTFTIPPFTSDGETYKGSGKLIDKLRVVLGNDCTILNVDRATVIFDEN